MLGAPKAEARDPFWCGAGAPPNARPCISTGTLPACNSSDAQPKLRIIKPVAEAPRSPVDTLKALRRNARPTAFFQVEPHSNVDVVPGNRVNAAPAPGSRRNATPPTT